MKTTFLKIHVGPHEVVVASQGDSPAQVLGPGSHPRSRNTLYFSLSTQWSQVQLAPQDIPTVDGAQVKVTAVARVRVSDPVLSLSFENPEQSIYLAIQLALRDEFAELDVLAAPTAPRKDPELLERVLSRSVDAAKAVGYELAEVVIKDVIVPSQLRVAALELLTAKTRGQAQIEAARAETAALRTLANGAKILEDHPTLAKLRMIQSIPAGSSLTLES